MSMTWGSEAELGLRKQPLDRAVRLDERRLDHDVAEVFLDADVAFEQRLDDFLVVVDAARDEAQQVVVAAADQMAFEDLVDFADRRLEADEVLAVVVAERDLGEHRERVAELLQPQLRAV